MAPLVAVTGGAGFLGRRLVQALAEWPCRVRVLIRRPAEVWNGFRPEVVIGSLEDEAALQRLTADAEVVVHAAGLIKATSAKAFFATNAEGARAVARAATSARRVILVSSLAAREPQLSAYAASKRAGEDAMRELLGERLTVVRPPAVYGPGDLATLPLFRFAASSPVLPALGGPQARLALTHVTDAAVAIRWLAKPEAPTGAFALGGARPAGYPWEEMLFALAGSLGRRTQVVDTPAWGLRAAGALSGAVGRLTGRAPMFTAGKAREILHPDWSVSPGELAPGAPRASYDLASGLADTVAWYRARGWLPPAAASAEPRPGG